jgi:hypothetical protein
VTPDRGRARVPQNAETITIVARFIVTLPPCKHKVHTEAEAQGCAMARKEWAVDAIGGGIYANMFGINERLLQVGSQDVHQWTVE